MRVYFDPAKNDRNIRERGLAFESAAQFDFESALVFVDARREYAETRYVALGFLAERLHVLCFAEAADGAREVSRYAKVKAAG